MCWRWWGDKRRFPAGRRGRGHHARKRFEERDIPQVDIDRTVEALSVHPDGLADQSLNAIEIRAALKAAGAQPMGDMTSALNL
jgi:hypothetical protein